MPPATLSGFVLPHLTEADPDDQSEGRLDPLGLAPIAEALADEIAPDVTARMSRLRFVTAMAVSAVVTERLVDDDRIDGQTSPELAFEWHVLEAFARDRGLPPAATDRVPGIGKARLALAKRRRLDSNGYLKTPKVFGFNGVYKRIARSMGVVHEDLTPAENGYELVGAWETRHGLKGFADRLPRSTGGRLANALEAAVASALEHGRVAVGPKRFGMLSGLLRPDGASGKERKLLWQRLLDPERGIRAEFVHALAHLDQLETEREALWALSARRPRISQALKMRLEAIAAYEQVAALLMSVFDTMRYESWRRGSTPTRVEDAATCEVVISASNLLPDAMRRADDRLERVGQGALLQERLGSFGEQLSGSELIELCLVHHAQVQQAKPPNGKRSWFDRSSQGFFVRLGYEAKEELVVRDEYLHPYRVRAIRSFIRDVA